MSAEKTKKVVGKVTPEQRDEIQSLFERRNSLKELMMIVNPAENNELYERVLADQTETRKRFEQWWSDRGKEYCWEGSENGNWEIDFQTCEIFLVSCDCQ